jgi:hypothetical protein
MGHTWTIDDFLIFIHEREQIRMKKDLGISPPWTDNPVLRDTRITNLNRNHDRGTVMLFTHVDDFDLYATIFYVVMYRSAYSSKPFINWLTRDVQVDLHRIKSNTLPKFGRIAYQVFLKGGQTMPDFLGSTVFSVVNQLYKNIQDWSNVSISYAAEEIARIFKSYHGMRLIFLGSEIAKDLSTLFPEIIDPDSPVPFNTGTYQFLNRIYRRKSLEYKIDAIKECSGLKNPSLIEHSCCEMGKVIERTEYYSKHGRFKKQWLRD